MRVRFNRMDLKSLVTGDDTILVEPPRASLGQLQLTNRLQMVRIDDDVLGVAETLRHIDPGLHILHDKKQRIWVIYHTGLNEHGQVKERLVFAVTELDQRTINRIRLIDAQGRGHYELQKELERLEREKEIEEDRKHAETMGPIAEHLRWALRKDLGARGSSVQMGGGDGIARNRAEKRAALKRRRGGTR